MLIVVILLLFLYKLFEDALIGPKICKQTQIETFFVCFRRHLKN